MKQITFGSICSGIEAASVAWLPLGLKALWLSEIEPYPCRVLAQRFPETPNLGDITALDFADRAATHGKPDIIVGGTPCQRYWYMWRWTATGKASEYAPVRVCLKCGGIVE